MLQINYCLIPFNVARESQFVSVPYESIPMATATYANSSTSFAHHDHHHEAEVYINPLQSHVHHHHHPQPTQMSSNETTMPYQVASTSNVTGQPRVMVLTVPEGMTGGSTITVRTIDGSLVQVINNYNVFKFVNDYHIIGRTSYGRRAGSKN